MYNLCMAQVPFVVCQVLRSSDMFLEKKILKGFYHIWARQPS